jgi:hypothetical protein
MKNKFRAAIATFALIVGLGVVASAETNYRTSNGEAVASYQQIRRVYRYPQRRVIILPNGRRVTRYNHGRPNYPLVNRARTYRMPNGRLVTVLPNGRRIYR